MERRGEHPKRSHKERSGFGRNPGDHQRRLFGKRTRSGRNLLTSTATMLKSGCKHYQDNVYAKCRVRISDQDSFHYIYALVDTGNQSRETIISEELFRKISPRDAEIRPTTVAINGIEDTMNILGRTADELQLEFYSPSPKFNKKVTYPCKPLVARNCNIDFLLSNSDLCKMDVTLKPKDGVMFIPLKKENNNDDKKGD